MSGKLRMHTKSVGQSQSIFLFIFFRLSIEWLIFHFRSPANICLTPFDAPVLNDIFKNADQGKPLYVQ